jgi:hypothetical protein
MIAKQETDAREAAAFPALVAEVVDQYTVVINRGSKHAVREGQRFLIYSVGGEVNDPETKAPLGRLEIVKGKGKVLHVQENMATLRSDSFGPPERKVVRQKGAPWLNSALGLGLEEEVVQSGALVAFSDPAIGDYAKPI